MILKEEKLFFLHVPKTGGTTVDYFLCDLYNRHLKDLTIFTNGFVAKTSYSGLNTIWETLCHIPYKDQLIMAKNSSIIIDNTWNIFTIVRNPYYRAVSAIFYQRYLGCHYGMHTLPTLIEKRKLFTQAYTQFFTTDPLKNNWWQHRLPQSEILKVHPLDNAPFCRIYKYEEGLENILKQALHLNTTPSLQSHHSAEQNRVPKTNYKDLFTRGFIESVNKFYAKDFEIFNYDMLNPLNYPED